jgi:ABC-type branched-subunit amino acid transport system ATPase component
MSADEPGSLPEQARSDPWTAVALLTIAVVAWLSFQTVQQFRERTALQNVRTAQEAALERAQKIRAQFDTITKKTLELAQQGNAGAALILDELARRGVTITPSSSAGPLPPPSK